MPRGIWSVIFLATFSSRGLPKGVKKAYPRIVRSAKDFFKPLAVGAPEPVREIPFRPSRMIHFFPAANEKKRSKVPQIAPTVDILLANILAEPLHSLAPKFASLVKPKGSIVLSGLLAEQADAIIDTYSQWFDMSPPVQREDWVRVSGIRR